MAAGTGFRKGQVKAQTLLGNAHLMMGEYDKAMDSHYKALKGSELAKDTADLTTAYINLGNVYLKIQDRERAAQHYLAAAELAQRAHDTLRLSKVYNNLGNVYEEQGEYQQARRFYQQAAGMQERLGDKRGWAVSLHNIGSLHLLTGDPGKGLPFLFQSVRLNEEIQNDMIRMASLGKIAEIYQRLGNTGEALRYAEQSLDMALKTESSKKIAEASRLLQAIHAAEKNYDQAYHYLSLFTEHNAVINDESRTKMTAELTARYETEQKELENRHLKAEKERQTAEIRYQRNQLILGGVAVVLLLVLIVVLYGSRRRLRTALAKLQEVHQLMQVQQAEIILQKNEIAEQAAVLQDQNEQLTRHNSFKNKVFSIISHDLRSPFYTIRSVLNLANVKAMAEEEVKHIFKLLRKDTEVALAMLDNMLVWAKAQLEESRVEPQTIDLQQLVAENIALSASLANQKGVTLVNELAEGTVALADRERLSFVLRNLLVNAIKFSYPEGEVRVQVRAQGACTALLVSDKGKGISAENVLKLFKDSRFTTPGTSSEEGTGLGLMLCKELVESFGGRISVSSVEGKGSTFSIALPAAITQAAAAK
ncbi:MAG: tetratricopeptide repeat-containing sensor histidine kinase [Hymenobacteraceae bacterium]|nr:tetratricopeptide repeat-containing sensor histidine kinase [Hymenobacteraceae bacterium]